MAGLRGKTINIMYWHGKKLNHLDWEGDEEIESSCKKSYRRKLSKILARIEDAGYNSMLLHHGQLSIRTTVCIADGRFNQC